MAIHETKKQSDLEKKLRLLRQQIYGKAEKKWDMRSEKLDKEVQNVISNFPPQNPSSHISLLTSDISYLYQDLTKIGILASIALGTQIIIFLLSRNHILNLNFF